MFVFLALWHDSKFLRTQNIFYFYLRFSDFRRKYCKLFWYLLALQKKPFKVTFSFTVSGTDASWTSGYGNCARPESEVLK